MPQSSIARWEVDSVEPSLTKVRRILRACGFDLSLSLIPFQRDPDQDARVVEVQRMTPQERTRRMIERRERE